MIKVKNLRNNSLVKLGKLTSEGHKSFYYINGAIYFFAINFHKSKKLGSLKHTYGYTMQKHHSFDIDDHFDFIIAKTLMNASLNEA